MKLIHLYLCIQWVAHAFLHVLSSLLSRPVIIILHTLLAYIALINIFLLLFSIRIKILLKSF